MTPERIFRSARSARVLVPYNLPRPVILLPSRKLAVCTIAMSVEPLRLHSPAPPRATSNCRHANFEILSKDTAAGLAREPGDDGFDLRGAADRARRRPPL